MSTPPEQLDLFAHSRDVMLRNDVLHALERREASAARAAWQALTEAFPLDATVHSLDVLILSLAQCTDTLLPDHEALAEACRSLAEDVAPSARAAFGTAAGDAWMRPMWRALALRCDHLPFIASRADDHAAAIWQRGESWADTARAVERIESWRRIPAPLAWMTEALCRSGQLDDAWGLLAELAWLSPTRLDELLGRLRDPLLHRLHKRFGTAFEGPAGDSADLAWFPAWILTDTPALAPRLALAQPSLHSDPERAMRLMLELLGLERQGRHHDIVQRRRALRDLHGPLYAAYMATR